MVRKQFQIQKKSSPWKYIALGLAIPAFVYRQEIGALFDRSLPQDETELALEYTLQSQIYVPEEFYIKLFGSDDFLPTKSRLDCYPDAAHCLGLEAFLRLDGEYHHHADLYTFAIQGIKSGHRPHNRINKITKTHDQSVTWLDAVQTLTRLDPEKREDQDLIRSWIVANYNNFLGKENMLDAQALEFVFESGEVKDIRYKGKNNNARYRLESYTDGRYQDADYEWVPSNKKEETFVVSDSKGHLILPATGNVDNMLVIPDYLLRNIDRVSAAVYTGKGHYSKYIISLEEINAELRQLDKNISSSVVTGNAQTILTPTLELVVQDICKGKKTRIAKLQALLETLQRVPYSDSKQNSPPLVTIVAGGQCGATSGQFAAMLKLCGFDDYQFILFPRANHIGVYIPSDGHTSMDLSQHPAFNYLYVETTSGKVRYLSDAILAYEEGQINVDAPQVFDLRPQLRHLPSAQLVQSKKYPKK